VTAVMSRRRLLALGGGLTAAAAAAWVGLESGDDPAPPTTGERVPTSNVPERVLASYWVSWGDRVMPSHVPSTYNVVNLFAAKRVPGTGTVQWGGPDVACQVARCRRRGQRVMLSIGGSGQGIVFGNRRTSEQLVRSVVRINRRLGGTLDEPALSGVDFNTYESHAHPDTAEYLWMVTELRQLFGEEFGISSPPAPWSKRDQVFCREMLDAGAMDYVAPQFYDGPGLARSDYLLQQLDIWISRVARGDARRVVVGFGVHQSLQDYWSPAEVATTWARVQRRFPDIRGAFVWDHLQDHRHEWRVGKELSSMIRPPLSPPPTTPARVSRRGCAARSPRTGDAL
jgi:hypothetical protein